MKKAGIITYFGENYGACLQAYAVQETIKQLGFETEIIDYLPQYEISRWRKYLSKIKSYLVTPDKYRISTRYKEQLALRSKKFEEFVSRYLTVTQRQYCDFFSLIKAELDYDVYITGSDQIWNPTHHPCNPVYFLDFAPEGKRRVAFAPSVARREIHDEYKEEMSRLLNNMDFISVREDINVKTLTKLVPQKTVEHVLDPTFMLTPEQWDEMIEEPLFKEPYIFCYLFGDLKYIREFVQYIREHTGYTMVSLPYNVREFDNDGMKIFNAGPSEFVNLVRNASMVITDSFHGTAFAINYQKPFYTLLRENDDDLDNMNSRFFSILKLVGLEERLVLPGHGFPDVSDMAINYSVPYKKLDEARTKTWEYLKRSLTL